MLDVNIDNLKFREDDSLSNCIYNIELYLRLLNVLQEILCPIETENDFNYVIQYYDNIKAIKTELGKNNIHQSFMLFHQFQDTEKTYFYIEKVKKSFDNIYKRWIHYYNEFIFDKAQRDYIYWNESPLKNIVHQTDSEFSSFKHFLGVFEKEIKPIPVKVKHQSSNTSETKENNQHNDIFSNNGFELFSYILKNFIAAKGERGRYADLSYYYWRMFEDTPKFIHQRPETFKNWFCQAYQESFEKIKTLNEVTDQKGNRNKHYSTAIDWFNKQS